MLIKCRVEGCENNRAGESRYCREHKREARERWREKVAADAAERGERYDNFRKVWQEACRAAEKAYTEAVPRPMVVVDELRGQKWYVNDGVCGFAEVAVRNGNSSFARWLKKNVSGARKRYYGGIGVSTYYLCPDLGQSYERKMAAAKAAAEVLRAAGIDAYADGRLD